ncbi:MAG: hypothetical protein H7Y07_17065 [Pyrinomonadaceae bacterium]|nr:hypothetical protein [Sphingobacteriaceae bacterium]
MRCNTVNRDGFYWGKGAGCNGRLMQNVVPFTFLAFFQKNWPVFFYAKCVSFTGIVNLTKSTYLASPLLLTVYLKIYVVSHVNAEILKAIEVYNAYL